MPKLTLSFKGNLLKYFPLREGASIIGSEPACDIFIDSLAIQPKHAKVTVLDEKIILYDLDSPDGVHVNGTRISGERELKDGDDIRVGKHNLKLTMAHEEESVEPGQILLEEDLPNIEEHDTGTDTQEDDDDLANKPEQARKNAFLQILNGPNLGKTIRLKRNLTHLGKPDVQLALIARRNDGYFLSHLAGSMPTQVGGQAIGEKAWQLQDGDIILIGNIRMLFTLS
ncbi:MAG: FHA domain-containing protein [Thiohalomonadaceae bacterium]